MEPKGKRKLFADNYLANGANGTQAYLDAGYSVKSSAVARANASRLLANANVTEYIETRLKVLEDAKIAKADEVLRTLTRIMRREEKEQNIVTLKKPTTIEVLSAKGDTYRKTTFEDVPAVVDSITRNSDAVRAGELLGKYYKMWTDRQEVDANQVIFVDDVPADDDD